MALLKCCRGLANLSQSNSEMRGGGCGWSENAVSSHAVALDGRWIQLEDAFSRLPHFC